MRGLGVLDSPGVSVTGAAPADDDLLTLVRDAGYLAAVRRPAPDVRHGLGTGDSLAFPGRWPSWPLPASWDSTRR